MEFFSTVVVQKCNTIRSKLSNIKNPLKIHHPYPIQQTICAHHFSNLKQQTFHSTPITQNFQIGFILNNKHCRIEIYRIKSIGWHRHHPSQYCQQDGKYESSIRIQFLVRFCPRSQKAFPAKYPFIPKEMKVLRFHHQYSLFFTFKTLIKRKEKQYFC